MRFRLKLVAIIGVGSLISGCQTLGDVATIAQPVTCAAAKSYLRTMPRKASRAERIAAEAAVVAACTRYR